MGNGARLMALVMVVTLLSACTGQSATPVRTIAPPPPSAWPTPDPCGSAVTQLGALVDALAGELAALRPVVVSTSFSGADSLSGARKVSATLTVYDGLEQAMGYCPETRALAQQVAALRTSAAAALVPALNMGMNDDEVERAAAVKLVGLLPKVLAISTADKGVADALGIDLQVAQVPTSALKPLGSLPPLSDTAPPTHTPVPNPTQAGTAGGGTSGSTSAAYSTAIAYQYSTSQTYQTDLLSNLNMLESINCDIGCTAEMEYAASQAQAPFKAAAVKSLKAHLAFMGSHPAAACFRAAYAADKPLANDWITLISGWLPMVSDTPEGRYQAGQAQTYLSMTNAFLGKFTSYFKTCGF